jgi:hypothetical protein
MGGKTYYSSLLVPPLWLLRENLTFKGESRRQEGGGRREEGGGRREGEYSKVRFSLSSHWGGGSKREFFIYDLLSYISFTPKSKKLFCASHRLSITSVIR